MISDSAIEARDPVMIRSLLNFRDIGGVSTSEGKTFREGIVFRSANPDKIKKDDILKLKQLGLSTIIDLRAPTESRNGRMTIEGIKTESLPLDFERKTRERLIPYLRKRNSRDAIANISNELYLEILDAAVPVFRQLSEILLTPGRSPVLIHCQAGKDRTGIICALLHLVAGTEHRSVINDFMASNNYIIPFYRKKLIARKIITLGLFPSDNILYAVTVRQRNIESVIDMVKNGYGGIKSYLNLSGFDISLFDALKEKLVMD